jgi:hypothetical protein
VGGSAGAGRGGAAFNDVGALAFIKGLLFSGNFASTADNDLSGMFTILP